MLDSIFARMRDSRRRRAAMLMNRQRVERVLSSVATCGPGLRVNGDCVIGGGHNVRLGGNVSFNGIWIDGGGGVTIGDNFHSASDVRIFTVNHDYDGGTALPYDSSVVHKPVVIEDNVWIGYGVIVTPGSIIREGAVIGAGAVVAGEIARCGVAVGNPARVVKYRDIEHYELLKAQGRFH
ncbi:MAG: acyltransferase [Coriobacteriia bacterium]|nr:acyltransferase [Coriobacteriia bacterium]